MLMIDSQPPTDSALDDRSLHTERGAVMAEYGLLISMVALVIVVLLVAFAPRIAQIFEWVSVGLGGDAPDLTSVTGPGTDPGSATE